MDSRQINIEERLDVVIEKIESVVDLLGACYVMLARIYDVGITSGDFAELVEQHEAGKLVGPEPLLQADD
jgi:3',5'-cyclic AMP phosphodiesterase CpdA